MMKVRLAIVLIGICFANSAIFAEGGTREVLKNLTYEQQLQLQKQISEYKFTQEDLNKSASQYGVEPNSRHILRMLGKYPKSTWEQEVAESKFLGHVQGDVGVSYPDPEEVVNSYPKYKLDHEAVKKYVREEYLPQLKKQVEEMDKPVPLPQCASSETIRKNISRSNNQSGNAPIQDLLFISPEKAPKDVDVTEFLGKNVSVLVYYPDKNTEIHRLARGLSVECLPMRFRTTAEAFFIDRGINALRNYDEDYHASGTLHPYFQ